MKRQNSYSRKVIVKWIQKEMKYIADRIGCDDNDDYVSGEIDAYDTVLSMLLDTEIDWNNS